MVGVSNVYKLTSSSSDINGGSERRLQYIQCARPFFGFTKEGVIVVEFLEEQNQPIGYSDARIYSP
jgi:hypothetical protein